MSNAAAAIHGQKETAIKAFDEKLAKLGYDGEHAPKRSHHKNDDKKQVT
jgi:hypothetical protein